MADESDDLGLQLDLLRWLARNHGGRIAADTRDNVYTNDDETSERAPVESFSRQVFEAIEPMLEETEKRAYFRHHLMFYRLRPDLRVVFTGDPRAGFSLADIPQGVDWKAREALSAFLKRMSKDE